MSTAPLRTPDGLLTRPFSTVLVANRGEIACRVIRSAQAAGYRTVAVHSDADADAPHVHMADEALRLGPAPAAESYLVVDKVLQAAADTGADAIHPGYGFLSENAAFARACHEADIVFIGPPPSAIALMGDKAAAKRRAAEAGVPMLPGYQGDEQDDDTLIARAADVGFPLMVKASAGGGGKGMRLVTDADDLAEAIRAARREAKGAFGDDTLLLERALLRPRHVEIQVLADAHGDVIALGERDCSVQRRHQKIVEEAPAPGLDPATRTAMQDAAVAAARDIGYVGAGTVEFLLDTTDGAHTSGTSGAIFSFLEMNTRLQVEHPVTELVTGVDLVDAQLRVAAGEPLALTQDDVTLTGHAIEVRLYAEDPANGYLPQTGPILRWAPPEGVGIRVDDGIRTGGSVTASYDPMIAKLMAHGRDRDEARRRLVRALRQTTLMGLRHNRTFLAQVLEDQAFASGDVSTALLDERPIEPTAPTPRDLAVAAAVLHHAREQHAGRRSPGLVGFRNTGALQTPMLLAVAGPVGGDPVEAHVHRDRSSTTVTVGEQTWQVQHVDGAIRLDGYRIAVDAHVVDRDRVLLRLPWIDLDVSDLTQVPPGEDGARGAGVLTAPMHGAVVAVQAAAGDEVTRGQPVVVMEAMKMEHVVAADIDGTVESVVAVGDQVADGDVVARITGADDDG